MYKYHYLQPENLWGVFDKQGYCVALFGTALEANEYCKRHNSAMVQA